jgi:hypothetical protein
MKSNCDKWRNLPVLGWGVWLADLEMEGYNVWEKSMFKKWTNTVIGLTILVLLSPFLFYYAYQARMEEYKKKEAKA